MKREMKKVYELLKTIESVEDHNAYNISAEPMTETPHRLHILFYLDYAVSVGLLSSSTKADKNGNAFVQCEITPAGFDYIETVESRLDERNIYCLPKSAG